MSADTEEQRERQAFLQEQVRSEEREHSEELQALQRER